MALPTPNLDDRHFQDLVDDAKRLVQRRCPEWTDHNVSDPGVTLIETFAYMADQLIYRLNRVPDRLHVKFLDLIGVRMFPPAPARARVTFWLSAHATAELVVPAGTRVGTPRTETVESTVFTTEDDLVAVPCSLVAAHTRAAGGELVEHRFSAALTTRFAAFSEVPGADDELLLALDAAAPDCAVEVVFDGRVEGIGVDPDHPPLVWEALTPGGWAPCAVLRDGTGGLNTSGSVVLELPAEHRPALLGGTRAGWLRARVVDPEDGRPPYTASPVVEGLAVATVGVSGTALHADLVVDEALGEAEGVAGQVFRLGSAPVLAGAVEVVLEVGGADGWQPWKRVDDFAESGEGDPHFVLDACAGEVLLGPVLRLPDGTTRQHGAVPERGAPVRVRRYAVGGGAGGNVAAGAISTLKSSVPFVAAVTNARSAQGGVEGETLEQARTRGALMLRTRGRAVTTEDYEVLARQAVPELSRVRCLAAGEAGVAAGAVKVLVVPAAAERDGVVDFADLVPDEAVLVRLAEHLDRVRPAGTSVLVEPPRYRGVTVVARVVALPRAKADRVREDALSALRRYLSPLPGGGPGGAGWPFGRSVRAGELHAVLQRVTGVDQVEDIRLFSANPVTGERGAERDRVDLEANSLVFSFDHQVRVDPR
ncbi:putative baseplate assembly protein [Actinokineospora bangkokensis]|uniref:Putative baseplate assembly protein n=1 Tax=Actinokineospora bangkokensis TaxID=1193682 RepID=A0A1Q9LLJ2_9PSEU|nr:putative baseplate assembly protein [Actinokineospora bangkokensis]OLR92864.1 putative baseplate assembly protein [Actinokineospora bangkokensis]